MGNADYFSRPGIHYNVAPDDRLVSAEPPLLLICVAHESRTLPAIVSSQDTLRNVSIALYGRCFLQPRVSGWSA